MAKKQKTQFKSHKGYRWIALFAKILAAPLLTYAFSGLTMKMTYINQTLGTFLSTTLTLVVYYGIIFVLNRYKNFQERPPLGKTIAVYTLVILILMAIESTFSGGIQNWLYSLTPLGIKEGEAIISVSTVNDPIIYNLIGIGVHFVFGYITGIILFLLFKYVLSKEEKLAKV